MELQSSIFISDEYYFVYVTAALWHLSRAVLIISTNENCNFRCNEIYNTLINNLDMCLINAHNINL